MAETSAQRLSRLLALVPWLSQRSGVSMSEAAAHFGVTPERLEKDLWLVVCCGLPGHGPDQLIDIQFWDDDGAIHVIDPQTLQRPLRLTTAEATALLVGLRLLAQVPGTHDRSGLLSVTEKIEEGLGAAEQRESTAFVVSGVQAAVVAAVAEAFRDEANLEITYAGATRAHVTERQVTPMSLEHAGGHDYLLAYCHRAGASRSFRMDRILRAEVVAGPATGRARQEADEVSVTPREGTHVVLDVEPSARWFIETAPLAASEPGIGGSTRATLIVADEGWLVRTVVSLGGAVVVVAPEHLRQHVLEAARIALPRY